MAGRPCQGVVYQFSVVYGQSTDGETLLDELVNTIDNQTEGTA